MVEKSTLGLVVLTGLVVLLSFKDLLLIKPNTQAQKTQENKPVVLDKDFLDMNNKNLNDFDSENGLDSTDNFENENPDESLAEKKIPSLKMKSNVQTLKILYWYEF